MIEPVSILITGVTRIRFSRPI